MERRRRELGVRALLLCGIATTIGTSSGDGHTRSAMDSYWIVPEGSFHLIVRATESAHRDATFFQVTFRTGAGSPVPATLLIEPDPSKLEVEAITLIAMGDCGECLAGRGGGGGSASPQPQGGAGGAGSAGRMARDSEAALKGASADLLDAYVSYTIPHELCPETGDCEIGFQITRNDDAGDRIDSALLQVETHVSRPSSNGAPVSCLNRDEPDFDPNAELTLETR